MKTPSRDGYDPAREPLEFLFQPVDEGVPHKTAWKKIDSEAFEASDVMRDAFPDLLTGARLARECLPLFAHGGPVTAMALSLDAIGPRVESSPPTIDGLPVRVGEVLRQIAADRGGFWGQFDEDLFGMVVPAPGTGADTTLADMIRATVKQSGGAVSIGIAPYPLLDFEPCATLVNAAKAVDHAAFFGPDSQVMFDAVSLNISGDVYYQDGDVQGAIREFQTALRLDPKNVNVLNSLGVCYGVEKKYEEALKAFEEALKYSDSEIMVIYNAGVVHMLADRYEPARNYFLRALAIHDNLFEVVFQLGRLCLKTGSLDQARVYLEKAVALAPHSSAAHRFLGHCYEGAGLDSEAVAEYKKAVKINPGDAESISALGYLFEVTGENPEIALTFGRKSVELDPGKGLYRLRLGRQYLTSNRLSEAMEAFEAAVRLGTDAGEWIEKVHARLQTEGNPCET